MATVNSSKFNIVVNRTTSTVTSQVNSNKFNIAVNRSNGENELGVNGKANTQVIIYKGGVQLTPTNSTPKDGQFKISIDSVQGCTAAIKNNDTVYINTLTEDTGTVIINITLSNGNVIKKYFTVQKSVALSSVKDIETRVTSAEHKITDKAITSVVKESQFIKDMNGKITTNTSNISKVEQTANSITSRVEGLDGKYTQLKQTVDGIDVTGKVSFSDLETSGKTVINGSNITTGTINGNLANITNINANNITTGTLNASKVSVTNLNANNITTGTLNASKVSVTNLNANNITTGTLDASKVNVTNLNASNITSGTISGNRISGGTIQGSLLQTYADNSTKGVRIAKESMQLNNASFFYKTDGNFNIQCKEGVNISSMQDIYIMPGLNASGTVTGNYDVVIPGCTTRIQKLNVVNDATISGKLSISSTLSANSLSTNGDIASSNGNVSANSLYASNKKIRLSYDSNTYVPGANATYGSYNLFLGDRKIFAPPNASLKALFVVNEYGQTGYINAHLATNTYAADIVEAKSISENSILDNTVVAETNKGKCIIPTVQTVSETEGEELEAILKRDCTAIKDGVIHNDITSMVYVLWEEVQRLKNEVKALKGVGTIE